MSGAATDPSRDLRADFGRATSNPECRPRRPRRSASPVTLRLTVEERARLEELAAGMTLSAYVRAQLFESEVKRRARRPKGVIADKAAAAEALARLGQSRIASNLNQLAHHANIGILIVGDAEKAQIAEANAHLKAIRGALMVALGQAP